MFLSPLSPSFSLLSLPSAFDIEPLAVFTGACSSACSLMMRTATWCVLYLLGAQSSASLLGGGSLGGDCSNNICQLSFTGLFDGGPSSSEAGGSNFGAVPEATVQYIASTTPLDISSTTRTAAYPISGLAATTGKPEPSAETAMALTTTLTSTLTLFSTSVRTVSISLPKLGTNFTSRSDSIGSGPTSAVSPLALTAPPTYGIVLSTTGRSAMVYNTTASYRLASGSGGTGLPFSASSSIIPLQSSGAKRLGHWCQFLSSFKVYL